MSNRSAELFLADIRESMARIERYTAGLDQAGFKTDEKTIDAVVSNQCSLKSEGKVSESEGGRTAGRQTVRRLASASN